MKVIEFEDGEYVVLSHVTSFIIDHNSVQVRLVSSRTCGMINTFNDKDVQARIDRISTQLKDHFGVES